MQECKVLVKAPESTSLYRKYNTDQLLNGDDNPLNGVLYFYPGSIKIRHSGTTDGEDFVHINYVKVRKKTDIAKDDQTTFPVAEQNDQPKVFRLAMKLLEIREITEISISNYMIGIQLANELFSWIKIEPKVLLALYEVLEMPIMVKSIHKGTYSFRYDDKFVDNIPVPHYKWFYFPGKITSDLEFIKIEDDDISKTEDASKIEHDILHRPGFPAGS